jgi:hypothetical protein
VGNLLVVWLLVGLVSLIGWVLLPPIARAVKANAVIVAALLFFALCLLAARQVSAPQREANRLPPKSERTDFRPDGPEAWGAVLVEPAPTKQDWRQDPVVDEPDWKIQEDSFPR